MQAVQLEGFLRDAESARTALAEPIAPESGQIVAFLRQPENANHLEEFRRLSRVSDAEAAWSIARQWIVIAASAWIALRAHHVLVYALAIVVIATRQHALGVLMHEGTHYRLFSSRRANDVLGDLLCAFPINMTVSRYRHDHLLHHKFNMTERDPYWQEWKADSHWHWPKARKEGLLLFAGDLLMLNMRRIGKTVSKWSPWSNHWSKAAYPTPLTPSERLRLYAFWVCVLTIVTLAKGWVPFLLLWALPLSTLVVLFARVRSVAEHLSLAETTEFERSRHVRGTLLERWTIAPLNVNIHLAHHLFPAVPQYNLPRLHRLLLAYPPYARGGAQYDSYLSGGRRVFRDMWTHGG
jgi:fatty acid desaturase